MGDAVNQLKCLHGTVISIKDEEKQVKCQHGTVISMEDEDKQVINANMAQSFRWTTQETNQNTCMAQSFR